jgi:hypothetical protein
MKRLTFWILLLVFGQLTWAQDDPKQKPNYKPWIVVHKMDNRAGDMEGKFFALEDSSIVLINPARLSSSAYRYVPVSSIEYLKVKGKANLMPRFLLGAAIGGGSFYVLSKNLDQSGNRQASTQVGVIGALFGGTLGLAIFPFRDFRLRIAINGRQDMYEANKPGMQKWVLE